MNTSSTNGLPFDDVQDFADADRGFVGAMEPCVVTTEDGRVVWDNDASGFLAADCPDTANPSLWRQSRLCTEQGLYEVTDGIYQVRGLDLSNMTLVEGDAGVIVIDPLPTWNPAGRKSQRATGPFLGGARFLTSPLRRAPRGCGRVTWEANGSHGHGER
jgi:alkyl sulfatase BDS1-like metallo-beta-lactamase superfamily hydrolase